MTDDYRELDKALAGNDEASDPETAKMKGAAARLEEALRFDAPKAGRERAMFLEAVAARRRGVLARRMSFAIVAAALIGLGFVARGAVPGETLYPVRKVLGTAGLADSAAEEIADRIRAARRMLTEAESTVGGDPGAAERSARQAIVDLGLARQHLEELGEAERSTRLREIRALEERAFAIIRIAPVLEDGDDDGEDEREEDSGGGDDNSGSGGGDDDEVEGPDDNSGSGSGDHDELEGPDDNSGSGSGDDSGSDDDNSGSGSGDNSGSDDSEKDDD